MAIEPPKMEFERVQVNVTPITFKLTRFQPKELQELG